ncbi:MAG: ATP-dependent nuclease [Sedimentisphaeraceae bacterium JB056]
MWISQIKLENVRCFEEASLNLSKGINILIGKNGSGKSTILNSILAFSQHNASISFNNYTQRAQPANLKSLISLKIQNGELKGRRINHGKETIDISAVRQESGKEIYINKNQRRGYDEKFFNLKRPENVLELFLSRRKLENITNQISSEVILQANGTFKFLNAQIDSLVSSLNSDAKFFKKAVEETLNNKTLSTHLVRDGKQAIWHVDDDTAIPIVDSGEGVLNILGFLVVLATSSNKVFIIEEIENDLHPQALKHLLRFIKEKSSDNQFIISTHSNIVLRELAVHNNQDERDTKIFNIKQKSEYYLPTSDVIEIESRSQRHEVLEDLGYDFSDLGLWKGWLFLEESSAERFIRDFFIPWFTPNLQGKLRTFSCRCSSQIKPKLEDFRNLFTFLHLTPIYNDKIWVCIDEGEEEKKKLEDIGNTFRSIPASNLIQFQKHDFEEYYPENFADEVSEILTYGQQEKRKAKKELLDRVIKWSQDNTTEAKKLFEESASEIKNILIQIDNALK